MLCTRASLSWSPRPLKEKCGEQKKYMAKHDKFKNPSITEYVEKFKEKNNKRKVLS